MNRRLASLFILLVGVGPFQPQATIAAETRAILNVTNVSCELCAPIVKRALSRVEGVRQVTVAETGTTATATVVYDDAVTNVPALIAATSRAGFPSQSVE